MVPTHEECSVSEKSHDAEGSVPETSGKKKSAARSSQSLKERLENYVPYVLLLAIVASAGTTWKVSDAVIVEPLESKLQDAEKKNSELKSKLDELEGKGESRVILVEGEIQFSDGAGRSDLVRMTLEPPRTYEIYRTNQFELNVIPYQAGNGKLKFPAIFIEHEGYEEFVLQLDLPEDGDSIKLETPIVLRRSE